MKERKRRVGELLRAEISELILRNIKDPRIGFVSITAVEMSPDLRYATVYYHVLGSDKDVKSSTAGLRSAKGYIRREIGRRLSLRYTPEITFKYDDTLDYAWHLESVLKTVAEKEKDLPSDEEL